MKSIPQYTFHKKKYGDELLIDVVDLHFIKKYTKNIPSHTLTYYDITFITEGGGFFRIDDKSWNVQPRDVVFSVPGEVRSWDKVNITGGYALIFEEEFLLSFFNDPGFLRNMSYFQPDRPTAQITLDDDMMKHLLILLNNIKEEIRIYHPNENHILRAMLYEALALLDREYRRIGIPVLTSITNLNRHIAAFVDLVDKHFTTEHRTEFYAKKLCLTSNYLNELVRKSLGISTKQYIQNRILVEAKRLLQYTDSSVLEISERLAFESSSYFIRFFRRHTGMTPIQFRSTFG